MELGVHSCIDKLGGPGERDPGMKNIDVATKVNDDEACRVLHITKAFQTSLGLRRCRKLTQRTFDEIGHLPILRTLDLLQTSIKTVAPLQHCHQLLSINLRYCAVQVRFIHMTRASFFLSLTETHECAGPAPTLNASRPQLSGSRFNRHSLRGALEDCPQLEDALY
jgi:hypothetical protein